MESYYFSFTKETIKVKKKKYFIEIRFCIFIRI